MNLLQRLSEQHINDIAPLLRPRVVESGAVLSLDHQLNHKMCFVQSGRFRLSIMSPAGTSVSIRTIEPGDHFGELWSFVDAPYFNYHVAADAAGVLLELSSYQVTDLCERIPEFSRSLTQSLAKTMVAQAARIYEFAFLDSRARLQAELLRLAGARQTGVSAVIDPAPTHAAIASQIGTTREGVTRHLRDFALRGLIHSQRGRIVLLNLPQIRSEVERETGGAAPTAYAAI